MEVTHGEVVSLQVGLWVGTAAAALAGFWVKVVHSITFPDIRQQPTDYCRCVPLLLIMAELD